MHLSKAKGEKKKKIVVKKARCNSFPLYSLYSSLRKLADCFISNKNGL